MGMGHACESQTQTRGASYARPREVEDGWKEEQQKNTRSTHVCRPWLAPIYPRSYARRTRESLETVSLFTSHQDVLSMGTVGSEG